VLVRIRIEPDVAIPSYGKYQGIAFVTALPAKAHLRSSRIGQGNLAMRLLRETNYFFAGGIIATALLIAWVLELLFRYG